MVRCRRSSATTRACRGPARCAPSSTSRPRRAGRRRREQRLDGLRVLGLARLDVLPHDLPDGGLVAAAAGRPRANIGARPAAPATKRHAIDDARVIRAETWSAPPPLVTGSGIRSMAFVVSKMGLMKPTTSSANGAKLIGQRMRIAFRSRISWTILVVCVEDKGRSCPAQRPRTALGFCFRSLQGPGAIRVPRGHRLVERVPAPARSPRRRPGARPRYKDGPHRPRRGNPSARSHARAAIPSVAGVVSLGIDTNTSRPIVVEACRLANRTFCHKPFP